MDSDAKIFRNPFLNFMVEFREEVKDQNLKQTQITIEAGKRWRTMTEEQKQPYVEIANDARNMERFVGIKRKRTNQSFGQRKRRLGNNYCSSNSSRSSISTLCSADYIE